MNQFLGSLALLPVERILNALIARDPHVVAKLLDFESKCIEVICSKPTFSLNVLFDNGAIKLSAIDSETLGIKADATISGEAGDLLSMLLKRADQRALADTTLDISGDATLVQDLQVMMQTLDVDWQDTLAPILGDVLSHELGKAQSSVKQWGESAGDSMQRGIHDYLTEEARLIPSRLEVDSFSNRLDELRLRLDRLNAKAELLQRRTSLLSEAK